MPSSFYVSENRTEHNGRPSLCRLLVALKSLPSSHQQQHRRASWCGGWGHRRGLVPLPFADVTGDRAGRGTAERRTAVQRFSSCSRRIKGFIAASVSSCRSSLQGKFSDGSCCLGSGREGYGGSDLADNPVSAAPAVQ